jgi:hypothetical protein
VTRFEARVLVGLILAAGALWAFLNIASEMARARPTPSTAADPAAAHARRPARSHRLEGVEEAVRDVTALGGRPW